jgi:hypothetical protein
MAADAPDAREKWEKFPLQRHKYGRKIVKQYK